MRRASRFLSPIAGVAVGIALVGSTGVAVAATGGTFLLGKANTASTTTTLTNSAGTPLSLKAPTGKAPLAVSSSVKVPLLNSDKVDGLDSLQLQRRVAGTCPSGQAARAVTALGSLGCTAVQVPLKNQVTVSALSTPVASGTALRAALAKITNGSATNPYEVRLGPGVFDAGSDSFDVPPFVVVVGESAEATQLIANPCTAPPASVLLGAGTGLRSLSVTTNSSCASSTAFAVFVRGAGVRTLDDVAVSASNSGVNGSAIAVYADEGAQLIMHNTQVLAANPNFSQAARVEGGSVMSISASTLRARGPSAFAVGVNSGAGIQVATTLLEGARFTDSSAGSVLRCVLTYDEAYAPVSCP